MKRIKICTGFTEVDKCKERKKNVFHDRDWEKALGEGNKHSLVIVSMKNESCLISYCAISNAEVDTKVLVVLMNNISSSMIPQDRICFFLLMLGM